MYDYAWVHVIYTIPVALLLTGILGPLLTRFDVYKICFLILVAFTYTLPWDSYLVKHKIWTYPADAVFGPSLLAVPIEELFFFVVQTYITTCFHILVNKPVLFAAYLRNENVNNGAGTPNFKIGKRIGQVFFATCFLVAITHTSPEGTYMKLIVGWVAPVFLMLWAFAYQLLLTLPWSKTLLPIATPTVFLWLVDTLALHRGTWSIEHGTKLGINLWPHLDLEEATFFLVTNSMIVFGSCAFDTALAILDVFPAHFPGASGTPSPVQLLKALFLPTKDYDAERLQGLRTALGVLAKKSRSFYLASGVFSGRLRIDLILLYGFCRVADDLIDDAPNAAEAERWIGNFTHFLDAAYSQKDSAGKVEQALMSFPADVRIILRLLPTDKLPAEPLYSLLNGFKMDLQFSPDDLGEQGPIRTEKDLEDYATCVAATVGELCLSLVFYHDPDQKVHDAIAKNNSLNAGIRMGRVLQYINIARDVTTDAEVGRCYIPGDWLPKSQNQTPEQMKQEILTLRKRIVDMAFKEYAINRDAIEDLPPYARGGIRVAVESYMEIGRELRRRIETGQNLDFAGSGKKGRASVPRKRRIWVGWRAMSGWRGAV